MKNPLLDLVTQASGAFGTGYQDLQIWLCQYRYGRVLLHVICVLRKAGRVSSMHWLGMQREWRHL